MIYLDAHTYQESSFDTLSIQSFLEVPPTIPLVPFSFGAHPWNVVRELKFSERQLELYKSDWCMAFGEIGLDKAKGPSLEVQENALKVFFETSKSFSDRPYIIHCVRAYQEVLKIIEVMQLMHRTFIWHNFMGPPELCQQILRVCPNSFFSFGQRVFDSPRAYRSLSKYLGTRTLLETDHLKSGAIQSLYAEVASREKVKLPKLVASIRHSFFLAYPRLEDLYKNQ